MEKKFLSQVLRRYMLSNAKLILVILICVFATNTIDAIDKPRKEEKKVDYLERIYFSGENKEGLTTQILIALQEIPTKARTESLTIQYTFLVDIKGKADVADNACDILDLLAVGIYNIDAAEAVKQGVKMPSENAKAKSGSALESLAKLQSTSSNLRNNAVDVAWTSYYLSGSLNNSIGGGASKVAGAAANVGNVVNVAGKTAQTAKQLTDLGKSLGIGFGKKERPCNTVRKKEVEIDDRPDAPVENSIVATEVNPTTNASAAKSSNLTSLTVINIQGINSSSLRTLTDTLRNKVGVHSVERTYNETLSTIAVSHEGTIGNLADWLEDRFATKYKLTNYGDGKINFVTKNK